ncbi:MAG: hypothetical protein ACTSV5_04325, partial [Promethearchaeota archaeon]
SSTGGTLTYPISPAFSGFSAILPTHKNETRKVVAKLINNETVTFEITYTDYSNVPETYEDMVVNVWEEMIEPTKLDNGDYIFQQSIVRILDIDDIRKNEAFNKFLKETCNETDSVQSESTEDIENK